MSKLLKQLFIIYLIHHFETSREMALKITLDPYKDVFVVAPKEFPPKKNLVVVPSSMLTKGQNVR